MRFQDFNDEEIVALAVALDADKYSWTTEANRRLIRRLTEEAEKVVQARNLIPDDDLPTEPVR